MYQHKNYSIELLLQDNGHAAKCNSPEHELLLKGCNSRADALYAATQAIDARDIASQIDAALNPIEGHDAAIDQVTQLVYGLVKLVDNG